MASPQRVWWRMCKRQKENRFAKCKTKSEVIDVYVSHLESLQKVAQQKYAIEPPEFEAYVQLKIGAKCVQHRRLQRRCDANNNTLFGKTSMINFAKFVARCLRSQMKRHLWHIVICAVVVVLINYKTETSNAFMRNIQTQIYPVMRAWRKITLPLINTFPALTDLYDETCLIENPLFRVANLDCTPCTGVANIINYTGSTAPKLYLDYSVPHIVQVIRSPH